MAAECVKHLEQHPLDTEAREKLAVIYADHYGRLDLAAGELEQMIAQPNQPGRLVVHWLNLLADLQIRRGAGFEVARQTLQRIVDRDPDGRRRRDRPPPAGAAEAGDEGKRKEPSGQAWLLRTEYRSEAGLTASLA